MINNVKELLMKLYIKLQMVPFVFNRLLLSLLRLFALICLVVIPSTLGGKPKVLR